MERRPRSPTGRNAPSNSGSGRGPKSGLESGFRKRSEGGSGGKGGNFSTHDGKEGFRSDDSSRSGPKRSYGDRPQRDNADKPQRSYSDRPKRDFGDRPARDDNRGSYGDSSKSGPKRSYGDRPQRDNADRPQRAYSDRPKRDFGDRPARDDNRGGYSDRPKRDFGDRPKRDFGDKPQRSYGDRPQRDNADRPQRSYEDRPKRSYGDKPERSGGYNDRPKRDFGDRPKRDFGDRPKRDFGDKPQRSYGDRPQRANGPSADRAPRYTGPRISVEVYGIHAVQAALLNPSRVIKAIYATESDIADIQGAIDQALEDGIRLPEVTIVEKEALHRALPRDAVHQGVGLDTEPMEEVFLHDIIRKAEVKKKSVVLLLDQVTDPHNIGAILRSACAFGADAVVVQSRNAPELSGLITKTASGAAEHVPLVYETNLSRAIETLKEAGFFCLALDERGTSISDAPSYEKTVLVLGAEGPGLRPLVKENCDLLVKLPTSGAISSLNVSNAAAISLFAIASKSSK